MKPSPVLNTFLKFWFYSYYRRSYCFYNQFYRKLHATRATIILPGGSLARRFTISLVGVVHCGSPCEEVYCIAKLIFSDVLVAAP